MSRADPPEKNPLLDRLMLSLIVQQALNPRGPDEESCGPVDAEHVGLAARPGRGISSEAVALVHELLEHPFAERRAVIAKDPRFQSAPLAALVLAEARRRPEEAEKLACTACLMVDAIGEEGRGLRVSVKVTLAEALRRKLDLEEAEAALLSAQEDLRGRESPWESAELCLGLAQLRWEQGRQEEACALGERGARLYADVLADREAAAAFVEVARWHLAQGKKCEAAMRFVNALRCAGEWEHRLAATRGLVQRLVLIRQGKGALALVHDVQRNGGPLTSEQAAVLKSLEGQIHLRLAHPRKAEGLLGEAFAVLRGSELRGDALTAGLALLVAGAPAGKVAAQLVALVPTLWRKELQGLLEEVVRCGQVRPEQLATLEKYLDLPERAVFSDSEGEAR